MLTIAETAGSYPLDIDTARFVASRFDFSMAVDRRDWFFEPYAG